MADRVARGPHAVSDVRVTIGAITGDAKSLEIVHLLGQGEERRVIVTPAGIEITAKTGGVQSTRASFPGRKCDAGLRLETIDGLFRVSLPEGKEWRELFSEPRETDKVEGFSGVTIEVQGGAARIDRLEVDRDVHYAWADESTSNSLPIPSDCVFLVGDNPEISTDSRNNRFGPVPLRALVGLARAVVWPFGRAGIVR